MLVLMAADDVVHCIEQRHPPDHRIGGQGADAGDQKRSMRIARSHVQFSASSVIYSTTLGLGQPVIYPDFGFSFKDTEFMQ